MPTENQLAHGQENMTCYLRFKVIKHNDVCSGTGCFRCLRKRPTFHFNLRGEATDESSILDGLRKNEKQLF